LYGQESPGRCFKAGVPGIEIPENIANIHLPVCAFLIRFPPFCISG
jgi:hypothetical protein